MKKPPPRILELKRKGGGGMTKETRAGAALLALALLFGAVGRAAWLDSGADAVPADAQAQIEAPLIALTFDDGPRRSTTTQLLDGLAQRGVPATFFLIGEQLEGNEDLVLRMEREGHQVGIHTYGHALLTGLNRADFDAQVDRTRQMLRQILGHNDFLLRPPYGLYDAGVQSMAGCPIILWSIDPEDWGDKNTDRIVRHIVENASNGAIVLLHDIYPTSVEAALRVVDELHAQGYLFVTVEQLFAAGGIALENGEVYCRATR